MGLDVVAIDADDTLWPCEHYFKLTQEQFAAMLRDYSEPAHLNQRLQSAERRNLALYGFGIKGFTLSLIETALSVTENRVPGNVIGRILEMGKAMLAHPIVPLPGVRETLEELARTYLLVLITKGDLFDQERKLAASGLGDFFRGVEIVSDKTRAVYERIFTTYGRGPEQGVMIGNALRSDIIPALNAGAWAIYIPHAESWEYEHDILPLHHPRFREISRFDLLPGLLQNIAGAA